MDESSYLLSDEFINFANKVKSIHEEKKAKKSELKAFYDKIQLELKALDAKAKTLEDEFNVWKNGQKGNSEE
jgi:transcription antitermination factor NusG